MWNPFRTNTPPPPEPLPPPLPPYREDGVCPKCGHKTIWTEYWDSRDAMKRTCSKCRASWFEAPLDATALGGAQ